MIFFIDIQYPINLRRFFQHFEWSFLEFSWAYNPHYIYFWNIDNGYEVLNSELPTSLKRNLVGRVKVLGNSTK